MSRNIWGGSMNGATATFRHSDGRLRSDFELGQPMEATRLLLARYPEPWKVVCVSHPQLIYADLRGRKGGGIDGKSRLSRPEGRILRGLGAKGRLA